METTGAFLLGPRLYGAWSECWTTNTDEGGFGEWINNLPKYVVTHRPIEGDLWSNTTVISEDHVAAVQAVKDSTDRDITLSGCATTVRRLLANNLLDELPCWCTRSWWAKDSTSSWRRVSTSSAPCR